jgi:hypothetical protein
MVWGKATKEKLEKLELQARRGMMKTQDNYSEADIDALTMDAGGKAKGKAKGKKK